MTIAVPVHRALSTKLASRSFHIVTRLGYNPWIARVNHSPDNNGLKSISSPSHSGRIYVISTRSYATTASSKRASRPKAHTGRTTTGRKPGPTTAAGKSKAGKAKKVKAGAKAKPKTKSKPKAVKKEPSKRALDIARIAKDKENKAKALLTEPKRLPENAYTVVFFEITKDNATTVPAGAKAAAEKYKNLSPEDKEHYNHIAHTNKEKNTIAYKKWVEQYSPEEILEANNARRRLRKAYRAKHPEAKKVSKFPLIRDDRQVKRAPSAFALFLKDRYASGDFKSMAATEGTPLIAREYKTLDAAEKKRWENAASAQSNRYAEECKTVYGRELSAPRKKSA